MQALRNDLYRPWFVGEKDWGIEFIDGEFSGVVIQFEKLEFSQKEEGNLEVEYHIIKQPEGMGLKEDNSNQLFSTAIELVINDILREAIENYEQTRNNDSKESGQ